jgi:transcriptional/translational regulatory protein YebC/TACO1
MDSSVTPAGEIIIRIEPQEAPKLRAALRNALALCEVARVNQSQPLDDSVSMDETGDRVEQLLDAFDPLDG